MFVIPSSARTSLPSWPINFIHGDKRSNARGLDPIHGDKEVVFRRQPRGSSSNFLRVRLTANDLSLLRSTRSREVTVPDVERMKKTREPLKYHMGAGMEFKVSFLNSRRDSFENRTYIRTCIRLESK